MTRTSITACLLGALATTSGCYYLMPPMTAAPFYGPAQPYAPPPQPYEQPQPYAPPPQPYEQPPQAYERPQQAPQQYQPGMEPFVPPQLQIGMGLSGGYLMSTAGTGLLLDLEGTVWLNEVLGIEVDVCRATTNDYDEGSQTITPLYVSLVATMPQGYGRPPYQGTSYWRMGVGYGAVSIEGQDPTSMVVLQFGYDWSVPEGGRVFSICDMMIGEEDTVDEYGYADPFFALTFRIGMEWRL